MNQTIRVSLLLAAVLCCASAPPTYAARSEATTLARGGVMRCGGNHHLRLGGTEAHITHYPIRNFDSATGIALDRLRIFDATGTVIFDSALSGITPSDGALGPGNVLEPNQTVAFQTEDLLPAFLDSAHRPIQLEVQWSAPAKVLTLDAITVRLSRARNPTTGQMLEERGRHAVDCRSIMLR
jgi:hypothetical protein